jgi:multiple sugar transport system ATP-binding protein
MKRHGMSLVRLQQVTKSFGKVEVIPPLDLVIADKEFVVLVGPSGCGKTTTLRMIAGLEQATSGEIRIGDRDVTNLRPGLRNCSMVFQNYALYPHMTVAENIGYGMKVRGTSKTDIETERAFGRTTPARRHWPCHCASARSFPVRRASFQSRCQAAH